MPRDSLSVLLLYAWWPTSSTISTYIGWPEHFMRHPRFRCTPVNLGGSRATRVAAAARILAGRYDGVVLLHSVFSNAPYLAGMLLRVLERVKAPAAYFIGNEYKLIPEKVAICRALAIRLFVTMTSTPKIHEAYRAALGCSVVSLPGGALDPAFFAPPPAGADRPTDLGMRASEEPLYFGHQDRRAIAGHVGARARELGLRADISFDDAQRLSRTDYARFLRSCRAQIGTEGGSDYFDLEDRPRRAVNAYLAQHPGADLAELQRTCLERWEPNPARTLTGRHVEAAGTKTVQVLFEGQYNGYFKADEHYIPLRKDFRNSDEVFEKLRDHTYCARIADNAYDMVQAELTYPRLIDRFYQAFAEVL